MVKPPFSKRQNPEQVEEFFTLKQGITDGLLPSIFEWTFSQYTHTDGLFIDEGRLGHLERIVDRHIVSVNGRDDTDELFEALAADRELLLDAADIALKWAKESEAALLEMYFREARSAYVVLGVNDGKHEIQLRQSQEMVALIESEANQPGRVAEHLRKACSKCFGLHPDLNEACFEAVKAIEVAAAPAVIPDDLEPTLGKMCSAVRAKPEKWETDSGFDGSVQTILGMMDMVWKGHLRHGDEDAPLEVSQEAAEMTVQTAVLFGELVPIRPDPVEVVAVRASASRLPPCDIGALGRYPSSTSPSVICRSSSACSCTHLNGIDLRKRCCPGSE